MQYVSVGHRPTLAKFHTRVLRLSARQGRAAEEGPKCSWEIYPAEEEEQRSKALYA